LKIFNYNESFRKKAKNLMNNEYQNYFYNIF